MYNFPIWLRLLPKTLFKIIDRDGMYAYCFTDLEKKEVCYRVYYI